MGRKQIDGNCTVFQSAELLRKQGSIVLYVNPFRIEYEILRKKAGQPHGQRPILSIQIQFRQLVIHHADLGIGFHSPRIRIPQQYRIDAESKRKLIAAQIAYGRQLNLIQTILRSISGSLFP